jgi:hypothetical protein
MDWEELERKMVGLYTDFEREQQEQQEQTDPDDDPLRFQVEATG